MKIEIVKLGKCRYSGISETSQEYLKRLKPFVNLECSFWKDSDADSKLLKLFQSDSVVVVLDERGEQMSSVDLSKNISKWMSNPSLKRVVFVVGGPYGLSTAIRGKANLLWSLSKCTLPSDLSWLILTEQIYRAFTIVKGMAYHHE